MLQSKIRRYIKHGTLPQLSVFEAVARLGSFTRAAEELYMAQPTVSVQIKKLTETVGLPLFEQVGKRVHLTEAGRELCKSARTSSSGSTPPRTALPTSAGSSRDTCGWQSAPPANISRRACSPHSCCSIPASKCRCRSTIAETLIERMAENADDLYIFANPPADAEVVTQMILPNPMVRVRTRRPSAGTTAEDPVRALGTGAVPDARTRLRHAHGCAAGI